MGVKDLWSILEPCLEKSSLDDLRDSVVAVDLGFWVCELKTAVQNANVAKPYLRNLFFRIWAMLQRNIRPIFVTEGDPPDVKQQTIQSRQFVRNKQAGSKSVYSQGNPGKIVKRTKFDACLKECCQLIEYLGLPFVESDGEAEAFCAALNFSGIVDAVITDDGDALLYGARTVYRNFNLDGLSLNLNREKLVALALLLGCDYCPKGVPGVGKENAMKFVEDFSDVDLLHKFKRWSLENPKDELPLLKSEDFIKRKALKLEDFPNKDIIKEFMRPRMVPIDLTRQTVVWNLPNLTLLHKFLSEKVEWTSEYIIAKVVPLITFWTLQRRSKISDPPVSVQKILRQTTRSIVDVYEVQWIKIASDIWTDKEFYVTFEQKILVDEVYPNLVAEFNELKTKKLKKPKSLKGSKKENLKPSNENVLNNSAFLFDLNDHDKEYCCISTSVDNFTVDQLTSNLESITFGDDTSDENVCRKENPTSDFVDCLDSASESPLPLSKRLQLLLPKHHNSVLLKK